MATAVRTVFLYTHGRILKANLRWSPSLSEILPVNCKVVSNSTSTQNTYDKNFASL